MNERGPSSIHLVNWVLVHSEYSYMGKSSRLIDGLFRLVSHGLDEKNCFFVALKSKNWFSILV